MLVHQVVDVRLVEGQPRGPVTIAYSHVILTCACAQSFDDRAEDQRHIAESNSQPVAA